MGSQFCRGTLVSRTANVIFGSHVGIPVKLMSHPTWVLWMGTCCITEYYGGFYGHCSSGKAIINCHSNVVE